MQTNIKQVFYFHGDAVSIGGFLEAPFRFVPTPNSAALSSAGGLVTTTTKGFNFEDGIKVNAAYTFVTGRPIQENGPWMQRVVSVVEGFDLFGVVTADRLVAQIFAEQPAAGGGLRKIAFSGTSFVNLRVNGKPVTPIYDNSLLPKQDTDVDAYNQNATCTPNLAWPVLNDVAVRQGAALVANRATPDWARSRFGSTHDTPIAGENRSGGYTLCSLVSQVDGLGPGQNFGHCIDVPGFGTIFLGEILAFPYSAQLTMLRAELCGKRQGQVCCDVVVTNGSSWPPN